MTTTSFFAHRQRLVSVFKDTMEQIQQSQDCQEAISYSLSQQQFISHEQPIDLPEKILPYERCQELRGILSACRHATRHIKRPTTDTKRGSAAKKQRIV